MWSVRSVKWYFFNDISVLRFKMCDMNNFIMILSTIKLCERLSQGPLYCFPFSDDIRSCVLLATLGFYCMTTVCAMCLLACLLSGSVSEVGRQELQQPKAITATQTHSPQLCFYQVWKKLGERFKEIWNPSFKKSKIIQDIPNKLERSSKIRFLTFAILVGVGWGQPARGFLAASERQHNNFLIIIFVIFFIIIIFGIFFIIIIFVTFSSRLSSSYYHQHIVCIFHHHHYRCHIFHLHWHSCHHICLFHNFAPKFTPAIALRVWFNFIFFISCWWKLWN